MAHRHLDDVLAARATRIRQRLRPLMVVMAGAGEIDPYRDG
jgi:hypothetical protein